MRSDLALRLYALNQDMHVPLPQFSDDDVVNFMVTEAIMLRGLQERAEQDKRREREEWKRRPVGSGTPGRSM